MVEIWNAFPECLVKAVSLTPKLVSDTLTSKMYKESSTQNSRHKVLVNGISMGRYLMVSMEKVGQKACFSTLIQQV